jgi:signal transduction histidine kinase
MFAAIHREQRISLPEDRQGDYNLLPTIFDMETSTVQLTELERLEVHMYLKNRLETEQQLLARMLHDGPLQEIHSVEFELAALAQSMRDEPGRSQLLRLRTGLQNVSRTLRTLCQELRPPALSAFGLGAAIRSYTDKFQEHNPAIAFTLSLADDAQILPEPLRFALFRICRRLLDNVAKHAAASHVTVALKLHNGQVILQIEDDGSGFQIPPQWIELMQKGCLGLIECLEEANAVGGHLDIHSTLGKGTRVHVTALYDNGTNNPKVGFAR